MALPALAIPAITAGLELGYNIYRGIKSDKALKALAKQRMPRYMDAAGPLQQNLGMATRQYQQGLSPQAEALAKGTAANQTAGQFRAATDLGGGQLGSALGRIGAFNTNQLGLQLGSMDQSARERGMQQMMGVNQQLSSLQQRDAAQDISNRLNKEQGYGLAKQQAMMGGINALSGFGQAAMYQNIYGGKSGADGSDGADAADAAAALGGNEAFADTDALTRRYMQMNPPRSLSAQYGTPLSMRRPMMTYPSLNTKFK
jgi:hypothetical protein